MRKIRRSVCRGGLLIAVLLSTGCARQALVREGITYAEPATKDLHLTLFLPKDRQPVELRPCVLLIHGGAWVAGSRHQLRWYGRHFAAEGYVAASISYRKLPRHRFLDSVQDAKAAVCWLKGHAQEYGIDPGRLVVMGNSAGGYLAAMLAATHGMPEFEKGIDESCDTRVSAAISMYGALDLEVYREPKSWIRVGGIARRLVGRYASDGETEGPDAFKTASPITYFGKTTSPMLFVQGDADNLVPADVARRSYEILKNNGVFARLITVPERGHAFDFLYRTLRQNIFIEMLRFLEMTGNAPAE